MTLYPVDQFFVKCDEARSVLGPQVIDEGDNTLLGRFKFHFDVVPANTIERIRAAQKIRYQVYCIEHPHEKSDNPNGLEWDEFDAHASHSILVHRATNMALGTLRLILPVANDLERSFPVQRVLDRTSLRAFNQLPLYCMAEVSRFSLSRQLRRMTDRCARPEYAASINNSGALMRLGLMQALVRMSRWHGVTHWCTVVEPTLERMLAAMAIRFHRIGPLIDYHGRRQPCYGVIADVLDAVKRERPAFWSVITDGSTVCDQLSMPTDDRRANS